MAEKRLQYPKERMAAALSAVKKEHMKVSHAADLYKVPRKTLEDKVKGKTPEVATVGWKPILTPEEEEALVAYIDYMSLHGHPVAR